MKENPDKMKIETIGMLQDEELTLYCLEIWRMGIAMTENHLLLRNLGYHLGWKSDFCRRSIVSRVKLGAGGGGCMIALTRNPKETSEAIELAGGKTLISRLPCKGLEVQDTNLQIWNPFDN